MQFVGHWISWVVVLVAVGFSAVMLGANIETDEADNASAGLPSDAESAHAADLADAIGAAEFVPALIVVDRGGEQLTASDRTAIEDLAGHLQDQVGSGQRVFSVPADDKEAVLIGVPLRTDLPEEERNAAVERLRDTVGGSLPDDLRAQVTGAPAISFDLGNVFDGADTRLLIVTASVVALLLLVTYRSPWLWLVPLSVVAVGDQVAASLVAVGTQVLPFQADGQSTGITSVLVFGAGTNYALLLIARYREELRRIENRYDAMRKAVGRAAPAIVASAGTVILALLCLGFADNPTSRNIGFGGAIGIATAVSYALLVLPAAMTCFGRWLFWPFMPRVGQRDPARSGWWARVAENVTARPVAVSLAGALALIAMAVPLTGAERGLSETEQFIDTPESVTGQQVLSDHFPAGSGQTTRVVVSEDAAERVKRAVAQIPAVQSVDDGGTGDGRSVLEVVLTTAPASDQAFAAVEAVRASATDVSPTALIGGPDAEALDTAETAERDQGLIIPLILGVVLLMLFALLRSAVAAVVLVLTVVATYLASLGVSWLAFTQLLDFPALDSSVPLLAFLFLVALGVDYNIFLTTRAKEEAEHANTTTAISTALAVTGGVITSAGILLAAVFTVLGVLPLIVLAQIGVIVGFGVLLDTLLVRSVLVPALITLLGRRFWWPGHLSRTTRSQTRTR
ncbi:MMPL family transporter [Nocardioidaceae bacterium SCSIO 66511]|nr:MMPL family transporter [Nocardioidaceae bacterium SCSIO 66511]